ncbi:unnamed protein product, partial [Aureobasidium mustum]
MFNPVDNMFKDDETAATSTTGIMTPTSQEPTITILLLVRQRPASEDVQVKMRRSMPFGKLAEMLRAKFKNTTHFYLRKALTTMPIDSKTQEDWQVIFDSDTPASLGLKNHLSDEVETATVPTTGMMTPTTHNHHLGERQRQKGHLRRDLQIKTRRSMPFRELVALLKTKFDQSETFGLEMELDSETVWSTYAAVFDSDTPD